jgi:hypothetical protein
MKDHPIDTPETNSRKPSNAPLSISTRRVFPVLLASNKLYREMSLTVLVAHCTRELNGYRSGEPYTENYSVELISRGTVQGNQEARACVRHCFGSLVLDMIHHHPHREAACRLKNEEHYMDQAFEHFWQAPASQPRMQYSTLASILHSLHVCLHGAILDSLRASDRPWDKPCQEPWKPRNPSTVDMMSSSELWEMLHSLLADRRELRLAYMLFHCGLKPREIVRIYPSEWSDIHEINRLRHTILFRLHKQADHLQL